jgi:hypothetical protein
MFAAQEVGRFTSGATLDDLPERRYGPDMRDPRAPYMGTASIMGTASLASDGSILPWR